MEVRDPIHGAMVLDASETIIADHPWVQRLRGIRQTGFSHLPFPGATHSRYAHSLGVMHLAGQAFDSAYADWTFDDPDARTRFRAVVRLAALCHDLGHAPFSHCTEFAMPAVSQLGISWYRGDLGSGGEASGQPGGRAATHEDYTIAILEHTDLARAIAAHFPFEARHVAALISRDVRVTDDFFFDGGLDHRRLLSQIVSSELDVDRLDYLVRDATYTGARYGWIDGSWLISNMEAWAADGQVCLALDGRALYAFDHFLLARHHMFLMVYFHHKSVVYEELLRRYVTDPASEWALPADLEAYLRVDDVSLIQHLRGSDHPFARRVVDQQPYRRVIERHGTPREADLGASVEALREEGIDVIHAASTGRLSRYDRIGRKRKRAPAIYVLDRVPGMPVERATNLVEASRVFERYAEERRISRIYVAPEDVGRARRILGLPVE